MRDVTLLVSRVLMSYIFIMASYGSVLSPAGRSGYLESLGLPGMLGWPSAAFELAASVALLIGFQFRYAAWALAGFCVATAVLVHFHPDDMMQMIMFKKNLAMAGGLLAMAEVGAGRFALDIKLRK